MDYRLENIYDDEFEQLVNTLCHKILGTGVIEFSKGTDGGRDGKFTGTAENFPSTTEKWSGKFIIQAKHTENPIASCSDNDFQRKIKKEEIQKLQKLKKNNEIDNYLLFTNRKFSGVKGSELVNTIKKQVGIENVEIIGKETINRYLSLNKEIRNQFNLDKFILPFDFTDTDLKELIIVFKNEIDKSKQNIKKDIDKIKSDLRYIDKDIKNTKNNLSNNYFKNVITTRSLGYFTQIDNFLQEPINVYLSDIYQDITAELNDLITIKRDDFAEFEEMFIYLYKFVEENNDDLKGKKRFIRIFLHYMYFNCDIGKK